MKENSFLKKFKGRMEQIGRNGYTEIMNNVHINIVDYLPKPKLVKKPKIKIDPYGHINSEIGEVFNKNINFMPQTKNISISPKRNKTEEIEKMVIKNNKYINMNKFNIKNSKENNKNREKEKEKPIKLLKNFKVNKRNKRDLKPLNTIDSRDSYDFDSKRYKSAKNKNKLMDSKKRSHSINLPIKLPKITETSSSPKKYNNNLVNNSKTQMKKSQERDSINNHRKDKNIDISKSQKNNDKYQKSYNKNENTEKGNLKNYMIREQYNLPKIDKKKFNKIMNLANDNKIKLYNKQKDEILSSIKNDFLMLDSIKNKVNNINKNQFIEYNNYDNKIKRENQINNKNKQNLYQKNINYIMNVSESNDINKQNTSNIKYSRNNFQNILYDKEENIEPTNKNILSINNENKPHTSFDYPQNIPKLKHKLDIIHEENEEDNNNKYITDVIFNNNIGNKQNLNSLEILMKQRAHFQNKIPNDSRFKLK